MLSIIKKICHSGFADIRSVYYFQILFTKASINLSFMSEVCTLKRYGMMHRSNLIESCASCHTVARSTALKIPRKSSSPPVARVLPKQLSAFLQSIRCDDFYVAHTHARTLMVFPHTHFAHTLTYAICPIYSSPTLALQR